MEFKRIPCGPGMKSSELPLDFLTMVSSVLHTNFEEGLQALARTLGREVTIQSTGRVYADEIVLMCSLVPKDAIATTTFHASVDFDPKASAPTAEDLLGACLDAIGSVMGSLLDPKRKGTIEALAEESIGALESAPFEWTKLDVDRFRVFVKVDKSNPSLETMTAKWLAENDPQAKDAAETETRETEDLFVTGKKKPTVH